MNNSYSGNFISSPLSWNVTSTSTPKKAQKKLPRNIDILEYLEDPSLALLREDMLRAKSFDSVSTEELERLYWHLRDYSYYCGRISNYDEALETEKLLEYVFLELKDRKSQSKSPIYSEILNPTFFQNQQMKWMQQLINFDEETEKKAESIKDRHNSEIKLLESRWKKSRLRPYNKLSPSLRDLTNQEQIASTAGDFTTARSLHDDIINKQKEELKEAQYKANNEYDLILDSLRQRQEAELANFLDTRLHKRQLLIRKQQNDLDTIEDKANISLYRINNNKPLKPQDLSLPFRGLIRPFIQTNQVNVHSCSPKLLPPIRPPPLKNENWFPQKSPGQKRLIKCVPKTRHKIDFQSNDFDVMNAMEILKRRFSKMTQDTNNEKTKELSKKKKNKNSADEDLYDFNAYYENQRNPAHLKIRKNKKKTKKEEPSKTQPYFEPVKRKMNFESIMKKVKEKEANKRKPPVIHSKRGRLKPPKKTNQFDGEEEEEFDGIVNESHYQYKQKVDVTSSINDVYDRIAGDGTNNKNKTSNKIEKNLQESKKLTNKDPSDFKQIEIIKKKRSKQIEILFPNKEKDKNELKLFFCERNNVIDEQYSSYSSYSYSDDNTQNDKDSVLSKKKQKKASSKKSSNGTEREYSCSSYYYNYSDYSNDDIENNFRDKDGNNIIIIKADNIDEKPYRDPISKEEYTKVIRIDYDYTNIKNTDEKEMEEEEEDEEEEEEIEEEEEEEEEANNSKLNLDKFNSNVKKKLLKNQPKEDGSSDFVKQKEDSKHIGRKGHIKNDPNKKTEKLSQNSHPNRENDLESKGANSSEEINTKRIKQQIRKQSSGENSSSKYFYSQTESENENHHSHHHHHHRHISHSSSNNNVDKIEYNENQKLHKKNHQDNNKSDFVPDDNNSHSFFSDSKSNSTFDNHEQHSASNNHKQHSDSNGHKQHSDSNNHKQHSDSDDHNSHSFFSDSKSNSISDNNKPRTSSDDHRQHSVSGDKSSRALESGIKNLRSAENSQIESASSDTGSHRSNTHHISSEQLHKDTDASSESANKEKTNQSCDSEKSAHSHPQKLQVDCGSTTSGGQKKEEIKMNKTITSNPFLKSDKEAEEENDKGVNKAPTISNISSYPQSTSSTEDGRIIKEEQPKSTRTYTYSKVTHLSNKNKSKDDFLADSPYVPKLALSAIVPLEAVQKTKKFECQKPPSIPKDQTKTPKPKKNKDEIEEEGISTERKETVFSLKDKTNSQRSNKHSNGRSIQKRVPSTRMPRMIHNNTVAPLNDGSLFGAGIETKSSGVVKVKH